MVSKKVKEDIRILLEQGYSINSIHKLMMKKHKKMNIKQSDIIIISKQNNIKVGSKDILKEKIDKKYVEAAIPQMLENKELVNNIKSKLIIIAISILVLILVLGFSINWTVALIVFGILFIIINIAIGISYFKFVKPNGKLRDIVKNK